MNDFDLFLLLLLLLLTISLISSRDNQVGGALDWLRFF